MLINAWLRITGDLRSSYELLLKPDLSPPSLLLPSLDRIAVTGVSDGRSRPRASSWMTQRLARHAEDRFITTSSHSVASATWSARRINCDEVSGDWIENGHRQFSRFRHWTNAVAVVWIKFDCDCGYETVTAPGRSHPQSRPRRFIRAAAALEERADPKTQRISQRMVAAYG
jgi:hypothetical protein